MVKYKKIYLDYFDYGEQDYIPCELCHRNSTEIHHIYGRGRDKNVITNLMAVCRRCHELAHNEQISKSEMQYIHNSFMLGNRKRFMK